MKKIPVIICLFLVLSNITHASEPYRILITNDDGISAKGLLALVEALSDNAEIVVSAPAQKMGGTGHATYLWQGPMTVDELDIHGSSRSYSVQGTPADAARFGILSAQQRGEPIDLVISGINSGDNAGSVAHISGTVGAAMEALYYNLPAIAVSLADDAAHHGQYRQAANFIDTLVPEIRKNGLPPGVMLNVNVPDDIKGVKVTPMGDYTVAVRSLKKTADGYLADIVYPASKQPGTDAYEFMQGYITITPLRLDMTDQPTLQLLQHWDIQTTR